MLSREILKMDILDRPKSGKIKQVCMNCKYNQRTYGKSKEFNEADYCS